MPVSTNASSADRNPFPDAAPLPFEEGVPSPEKVRAMASWLRRHSGKYDYGRIEYVVLYHATGISIPVLEQGLLPTSVTRRRSYQSTSGYVYLAPTPERAKTFGDLGNGGRSRIYAVKVPVKALRADTDQLNNLRSVGVIVGNSVAESIVYGGSVRVKGRIEAWQIREVFFPPVHRGDEITQFNYRGKASFYP